MAKTPTAHLLVFTVEVHCPHCSEPQDNPSNGAQNWSHEELERTWGTERVCLCCGKMYRMPNKPPARITFDAVV